MHHFEHKAGTLFCEKIPVEKIADEVGTPFYLYSLATLKRHYKAFDVAFEGVEHLVCFAVKANSNTAILHELSEFGSGFDIVSGGELFRTLKAGASPDKIVYSGVGKTVEEIKFAIETGILSFNIESMQELEVMNYVAESLDSQARISLRVNPDIDPKTHPYVSTGLKSNKFGVDIEESVDLYKKAREFENIEIMGVSCHIGSQLTSVDPFVAAFKKLKELIVRLRDEGFAIEYVNLGGGLGITYEDEEPPLPSDYAKALMDEAKGLDIKFIFEPGRVIVGNAGILVSRVLYTKKTSMKNFVIVDAGMNDLMRPSLYNAYHEVQPVRPRDGDEVRVDVVGPLCETGDWLAKARSIKPLQSGDLLAVMGAGAYGFSMSSNYNSRPRVAEVLVDGSGYKIIRKRETYGDLISGEDF